MGREAKTPEEIVEYLLANAIPNGGCLECHLRPSVDRAGRERQYVSVGGRNGKKWGVPRLVLHVKEGPLPDDIWALHSCDNSKCINLKHLFKGTAKDNTQDMMQKERWSNGDNSHLEVKKTYTGRWIKQLLDKGYSIGLIADELYISLTTVRNYINPKGIYHEYLK